MWGQAKRGGQAQGEWEEGEALGPPYHDDKVGRVARRAIPGTGHRPEWTIRGDIARIIPRNNALPSETAKPNRQATKLSPRVAKLSCECRTQKLPLGKLPREFIPGLFTLGWQFVPRRQRKTPRDSHPAGFSCLRPRPLPRPRANHPGPPPRSRRRSAGPLPPRPAPSAPASRGIDPRARPTLRGRKPSGGSASHVPPPR